MRVLFTGQAGTAKSVLATSLADFLLRTRGIALSVQDPTAQEIIRPVIQVREVEDPGRGGFADLYDFLNSNNDSWKRHIWRTALSSILDDLQRPRVPEHAFLLIHNYFYRSGNYFTCVDLDLLRRFQPDLVITLIDDIHDIWQRIELRETGRDDRGRERPVTRSHFTLEELLTWRNIESSASAQLAATLQVPHHLMAIKHPLTTFFNLIFKRNERMIVYACCAITNTREVPARREQVDEYRRALAQHFTVIDPLTIDELLLPPDDAAWRQLGEMANFEAFCAKRWPLQDPAVPPPPLGANPFAGMSGDGIFALQKNISNQIVTRDFTLVAQSDCVPAYRPYYPHYKRNADGSIDMTAVIGEKSISMSAGMEEEITFALDLRPPVHPRNIPVRIYHPRCDHLPAHTTFFRRLGSRGRAMFFPDLDRIPQLPEDDSSGLYELIEHLSTLQPGILRQRR